MAESLSLFKLVKGLLQPFVFLFQLLVVRPSQAVDVWMTPEISTVIASKMDCTTCNRFNSNKINTHTFSLSFLSPTVLYHIF